MPRLILGPVEKSQNSRRDRSQVQSPFRVRARQLTSIFPFSETNVNGTRRTMDHRVGAVVIGGDYQGLGIVRSLGRQGVPVCVVDDEAFN